MRRYVIATWLALVLAACGGGGGGNGSGGGGTSGGAPGTATPQPEPPANSGPALRFTPAAANATWEAGTSISVPVIADVNRPGDFTASDKVYAFLVDTKGVILPTVRIDQMNALQYGFVLQTAPNLAPGTYKDNFAIMLCRDPGCAQHYPGSPMQLPYNFEVKAPKAPFTATNDQPLAVTAYQGGTVAPVRIAVNGAGRTWTVASDAPWAKVSTGSGRDDGAVTVTYDMAGLGAGTFSGKLTLKASDDQVVELPLTLQILPYAFRFDRSLISFNYVNGAPIDKQPIRISYEGDVAAPWSASSDVAWLGVSPTSGIAPSDTELAVASKHALASGTYAGNLTLTAPSKTSRTIPVQLNLVAPTLTLSGESLTFGGPLGRDFKTQALTLNLNTLTNAWPWKLGTLPGWVGAATSGTVSQIGTTITFTPKPDTIPVGTSSKVVNATVTVNGDTLVKPVALTINKDQRKILASETGVAFVSTPQWSRLTRTLTVAANYGGSALWEADSDQSWLAATVNGNKLTLTADAASLAQGAVHYATVTLVSQEAGVTAPEPIRVALWKGAAAPAAIAKIARGYQKIIADPIRPFVYVHNGGTAIETYNVYTGARIGTSAMLGAALGNMAVAPNGDSLYVTDTANRNVVKVSLPGLAKAATWPLPTAVDAYAHVLAARPNGVGIVMLSNGIVLAAADGRELSRNGPAGGVLAAPASGKRVYVIEEGYSPSALYNYDTDYSAMGGGTLFATRSTGAGWGGAGSNGRDVAVSPDGLRVYTASGSPYQCSAFMGKDLSAIGMLPGGDAYPDNVEVGSDGRVYCGISGWYSDADVWVYSAAGKLLKDFKFAGYAKELLPRQMVVSGDGMILVGLTDDPVMAIVPVGP